MSSRHGSRRHLLVVGLLVSAGLVVGGIWLSHWDKESLGIWANTTQILGLALGVITTIASFRPSPGPTLDGEQAVDRAATMLATVVQQQWGEELARRNLGTTALPIRWSVVRKTAGVKGAVTPQWTADASQVAEAFIQAPTLRLVVLGEPGAGKSILAMLLTLGLLERRPSDGPVPILLSLSSWLPDREGLVTWMARCLTEDYPFLAKAELYGPQAARQLVTTGRVVPILDALDELPEALQTTAIQKINAALPRGGPLVVTSRRRQYRTAVRQGGWQVAHTVEVELRPPDLHHVEAFLTSTDQPAAAKRWRLVFAALRSNAKSPLATVLQTPLMAALARTIYADPATNPRELLAFKSRSVIEQHLLRAMIKVSYSRRQPDIPELATSSLRRYRPNRARHYLTRFALHMRGPDLQWWSLRDTVARPFRVWSAAIVGGLIVAAVDGLFVLVFSTVAMGKPFLGILWWIVVYLPLFALGGGATLALLVGLRPFGPKPSRVGAPGQAMTFKTTLITAVAWGAGSLWVNWTKADLPDVITGSLVIGATAFIYGGALMILRPVDHTVITNARALLRADRWRALLQVPAIALVASLALTYALIKFNGLGFRDASFLAGLFGLTGGVVLALHHTAWGHWLLVTRIWLPWRIITFLEDAYARGILRRAGAAYQFRHERLQRYLTNPQS